MKPGDDPGRVLLLYFADGRAATIPVNRYTVVRVGAESFSMQDCVNVLLVDPDDSILDVARSSS